MQNNISEAKRLVQKLNTAINNLNTNQFIPQIEIDLMKDYLRQLYDLANQLKLVEVNSPIKEEREEINSEKVQRQISEPGIQKEQQAKLVKETFGFMFEKEEEVEAQAEEKVVISPQAEHKSFLNEKLHADKETLADKIKVKSTSDLRTAIDLNDKFFFIKELFNGDSYAFDKAIRFLNGLTQMEDAKIYIEKDLSVNYRWQQKQDVVNKFVRAISVKY